MYRIKRVSGSYNPNATCPKYGGEEVSTGYREKDSYGDICYPYIEREHHRLHCQRCHYEWPEGVLNNPTHPAAGGEGE